MENNIKKTKKRNQQRLVYVMAVIAFILIIISAVYAIKQICAGIKNSQTVPAIVEVYPTEKPIHEKIITITPGPMPGKENHKTNKNNKSTEIEEENIFTYLQGPKSWKERISWSGPWGKRFYDGGSFGGFGCGLCCLANVYSTFSSGRCTPVDMYKFTRKKTGYSGGGAIAWEYMDTALNKLGFNTSLKLKPKSYKNFKKQITNAKCSIVLISSNNSKCYWKNTPGHYVTIFLYDKKSDTVFLADSGNPSHNRKRIELRKIYKSLKTESEWQYLNIGRYNKSSDIWKHQRLNKRWSVPEYIG